VTVNVIQRIAGTPIATPLLVAASAGRDLALADSGNTIVYTSSSGGNFTIPNDATVAWQGNDTITLYMASTGAPAFAAGSGVTLRSAVGIPSAVQYGIIAAMRVAANEWALI
jgi:hypothetical protein